MVRWRIAILVAVAIAINYLDRLTLPSVIDQMPKHMILDKQAFALLNTAFLAAYGAMYLVGGKLLDFLGTRRGFTIIIVFWSVACASHGFATGMAMLVLSRLLLGLGEGGGFPGATRAVAEWFPVKERSIAMGMINGATGVGGMIALPLVWVLLTYTGWFGIEPWRWVFFITGSLGLLWLIWWLADYFIPEKHWGVTQREKLHIQMGMPAPTPPQPQGFPVILSDGSTAPQPAAEYPPAQQKVSLAVLFKHKETWGIVVAKFLTDAAWYFILFWLPTYLNNLYKTLHPEQTGYNFGKTASVAWIPNAGALVGCLLGGSLSSYLLRRHMSVNAARKWALFASAIIMPLLILVPYFNNVAIVIALLTAGYFGQQSWSTLIMVLPTDLFPKRAVGTVAGLVGLGGALGGIALGQLASYLLDHHYSYRPVMLIAGLLHVSAFVVILLVVPNIRPLELAAEARHGLAAAFDSLVLAVKIQIPAILFMLLGLIVVQCVMGPANYNFALIAAIGSLLLMLVLLALFSTRAIAENGAVACGMITLMSIAAKIFFVAQPGKWTADEALASCCIALSILADLILCLAAWTYVVKSTSAQPQIAEKVPL